MREQKLAPSHFFFKINVACFIINIATAKISKRQKILQFYISVILNAWINLTTPIRHAVIGVTSHDDDDDDDGGGGGALSSHYCTVLRVRCVGDEGRIPHSRGIGRGKEQQFYYPRTFASSQKGKEGKGKRKEREKEKEKEKGKGKEREKERGKEIAYLWCKKQGW